jgi:enoyl-CoA hydratase/carnithine racemase
LELKATEYSVASGIATVRLNRPHRLNAWTGRMHSEYRWCIDRAERDPAVRAIVVTGNGRGFCVGGDAEALEGHARKGGYDPGTPARLAAPGYGRAPEFDASFAYHYGLSKPVIAAVNGPDLPAEYGLSWLLPRMIGLTRANDLLLSSRVFLAEEALAMGLVNAVYPQAELMDEVYAYTRELIRTVSPASLAQTRWQIYRDLHRSVAESVRASEQLLDEMMRQEDYREGVAAFLEKRAPSWSGSAGETGE